jgi:DNA-binding PadR family transcriptional regulator
MGLLTRADELVLVAILKLGEKAYSLPILDQIEKITNQKWTLGGIYIPLYRLEKRGFLESELGDPSDKRGGKRKRYFRVTSTGREALRTLKKIQSNMYAEISDILLDSK